MVNAWGGRVRYARRGGDSRPIHDQMYKGASNKIGSQTNRQQDQPDNHIPDNTERRTGKPGTGKGKQHDQHVMQFNGSIAAFRHT